MRVLFIILALQLLPFTTAFAQPEQVIVAPWDSTYQAIIRPNTNSRIPDAQYLELVIGKDTAYLPDSLDLGDNIMRASFVKFDHIPSPCLEVIFDRHGKFQYYLFEIAKPDSFVTGRSIAIIENSSYCSFKKGYPLLNLLYQYQNLEIIREDKNKDGNLDLGFKDLMTNKVYWLYWNKKKKMFKE